MFFKIGSLQNFAIFTGKQLSWGLQVTPIQVFPVDIAKFIRAACYRAPSATDSDSPTTAQQSQLGCLFFDFAPPRAFNFGQKLNTKRCTKFLPCFNSLIKCFRFQNMF